MTAPNATGGHRANGAARQVQSKESAEIVAAFDASRQAALDQPCRCGPRRTMRCATCVAWARHAQELDRRRAERWHAAARQWPRRRQPLLELQAWRGRMLEALGVI